MGTRPKNFQLYCKRLRPNETIKIRGVLERSPYSGKYGYLRAQQTCRRYQGAMVWSWRLRNHPRNQWWCVLSNYARQSNCNQDLDARLSSSASRLIQRRRLLWRTSSAEERTKSRKRSCRHLTPSCLTGPQVFLEATWSDRPDPDAKHAELR